MTDKLIIPEIGFLLMKTEGTSGSKETLALSDVVYVEEFTFDYSADMIARTPRSPSRQGVMSRAGKKRVEWTATTELAMPDAFDTSTDVPHPDTFLKAAGFARQDFSTVPSTEAALYVLQVSNHESVSFEGYTFTADGASANVVQGRGARADFEFSINPDDGRIMLGLTAGRALEAATPAVSPTYTNSDTQSRAVTYYGGEANKPFLAHDMHAEIVNLEDDTIYGGGSLGSPSNTFQVVGLTIAGAMAPTEQTGIAALSGVARERLSPTAPVTATVSIEEILIGQTGAFDPYDLRNSEVPLEFRLKSSQADITGNTNDLTINFFGQITGVARTAADGRVLWDLDIELRYPEDSSDGAPAVGVSPTQVFNTDVAGTKGLFIDETLTVDGLLCVGFIKT
jgi:hypothetical protein